HELQLFPGIPRGGFSSTELTLDGAVGPAQAHPKGTMAFSGKYEFEGLPSDKAEMGRNCKIVTEVVQNGNDFTWTQHFPGGRTTTNTFTVGAEADMETMGGKKFKATVKLEDGKLVADFPNYRHTAEISGGKLVECQDGGSRGHIVVPSVGIKSLDPVLAIVDQANGQVLVGQGDVV
ncbi:Gastrotropin, partial [Lamprotornis superbus]